MPTQNAGKFPCADAAARSSTRFVPARLTPRLSTLETHLVLVAAGFAASLLSPPGARDRRACSPSPRPATERKANPVRRYPAGRRNHSRRTGRKLGRLRRARQEIVRVPESNTKSGGIWGKPAVPPGSNPGQVSVSPSGFAKLEISPPGPWNGASPLFTGRPGQQ